MRQDAEIYNLLHACFADARDNAPGYKNRDHVPTGTLLARPRNFPSLHRNSRIPARRTLWAGLVNWNERSNKQENKGSFFSTKEKKIHTTVEKSLSTLHSASTTLPWNSSIEEKFLTILPWNSSSQGKFLTILPWNSSSQGKFLTILPWSSSSEEKFLTILPWNSSSQGKNAETLEKTFTTLKYLTEIRENLSEAQEISAEWHEKSAGILKEK